MTTLNQTQFDHWKLENGAVSWEGVEYALTNNANINDNDTYKAIGVSMDMLNEAGENPKEWFESSDGAVEIYWDIINSESDDESDACYWDKPSKLIIL